MIHLFIAALWLGFGAALILVPDQFPEAFQRRIAGTQLSAGWVFILFAAWHTFRWWRLGSARRQTMRESRARERHAYGEPEYNPEFDFKKDEPRPPAG